MSFSVDTMNRLMKNHSFLRQTPLVYTCCTMAVNLVQLSLWKFVLDLLLWVPFWKKYNMVVSKYDCIANTCWNIIILYNRKTTVALASLSSCGRYRTCTRTKTDHRFSTRRQSLSNFWQIFSLFIFWIFTIYVLYHWLYYLKCNDKLKSWVLILIILCFTFILGKILFKSAVHSKSDLLITFLTIYSLNFQFSVQNLSDILKIQLKSTIIIRAKINTIMSIKVSFEFYKTRSHRVWVVNLYAYQKKIWCKLVYFSFDNHIQPLSIRNWQLLSTLCWMYVSLP